MSPGYFNRARFEAPSPAAELVLFTLLAWAGFIAIPIVQGGIGLSWDALNHHMYLGWTAASPRFDRDFLAASYQSFQYPYLYWPAYELYIHDWSGTAAGVVLASLAVVGVPAVWMLARACVADRDWYGFAMRGLSVALAFSGSVVLSMFDTTANDLLAAIPLVWGIAMAIEAMGAKVATRRTLGCVLLSGFASGISVAFKLSSGPLAILMPFLWVFVRGSTVERLVLAFVGCAATVAGFMLAYGPWGWQLWLHYGNPVYPFYDGWFEPLRNAWSWHP